MGLGCLGLGSGAEAGACLRRFATRLAIEAMRAEMRQEANLTNLQDRVIRHARVWGDAAWTSHVVFREPPEPLLKYFGEFFGREKYQAEPPPPKKHALHSKYRWLQRKKKGAPHRQALKSGIVGEPRWRVMQKRRIKWAAAREAKRRGARARDILPH